jgi:3-isopropylmalate/(R)-2-methylmalate dehydratase small subunit
VLPQADIDSMVARAEDAPGFEAEVDLESQTVRFGSEVRSFEIDPFVKNCLLKGLDDIALTLQAGDAIDTFEASRPVYKPRTAAATP